MLVNEQTVAEFPLSLEEYPRWLSEHNSQLQTQANSTEKEANTGVSISNKERKRNEAEQRKKTQPLRNKIKKLETIMQKSAETLDGINQKLADSDIYSDANKERLQQLLLERAAQEKTQTDAEEEWLISSEELESL